MERLQENQWQRQKAEQALDRKHFSRIAFGFLIYTITGVGLQILFAVIIRNSGWDYSPYRSSLNWLLNLTAMYLIALPVAVLYFSRVPKFGQVRNERWELKAWLVVFLIGLSMGYFGNIIGSLVSVITGGISTDYESLIDMILEGNIFLTFLNVVIGAPIAEELLFRKFLIDRTIGYGEKVSVFLSGTMFGMMHGNFQQFFYAFALGCLFAYIYCKTGKIQNTILFHMWINFSGSILVPGLMRFVYSDSGDVIIDEFLNNALSVIMLLLVMGYILLQLIAAVAGFVLFFVFKKYICFYQGIRQIQKGKFFQTIVLNVGMFSFFFLCFLDFF